MIYGQKIQIINSVQAAFTVQVEKNDVTPGTCVASGKVVDSLAEQLAGDNGYTIVKLTWWELSPYDMLGQFTYGWDTPWVGFLVKAVYEIRKA